MDVDGSQSYAMDSDSENSNFSSAISTLSISNTSTNNKRDLRNITNVNTAKKSTSLPSYRPPTRQTDTLRKQTTKFMENFNPETSTREKRKLHRKLTSASKTAYNEKGVHLISQIDFCDCLVKECPGCHFPCRKCKSSKCGSDCRVNRKFVYDQVDYCGCDIVFKNPFANAEPSK